MAERKGLSLAASPVSPSDVPFQRMGYGFPMVALSKDIFAAWSDGAWKTALHAPKDDPINWVASQK